VITNIEVDKFLSEEQQLESRQQELIKDLLRQKEAAIKAFDEKLARLGHQDGSAPKRSHHKHRACQLPQSSRVRVGNRVKIQNRSTLRNRTLNSSLPDYLPTWETGKFLPCSSNAPFWADSDKSKQSLGGELLLLHGFLVFALTLDLSTDPGKENVVLASLTPSARTVAWFDREGFTGSPALPTPLSNQLQSV
jgi:hypothetical protein